ncbi:MAG: carbon monoxide dehydrogenase [Acidimicrobiaceae bacterium]|nr:carbon monoxide dehydrogenase [Acidimicrobiaceae bacterium]|tara:strand:+ start:673 stop:1284 length:612 start_codon:yes stop_codon:yes gene_type:complete
MELNNDIEVNASVDEVWEAFNTPEKIAPCLPGAELQENEGEEFHGIVKIKVGPITAQYKGTATYLERNNEDKKVVIKGDGRDVRGAGNASAIITAQLTEISPTTTQVSVKTELTITGKVAQFGRGAISDVSAKLMTQFAKNLEELLEPSESNSPEKDLITPSSPNEEEALNLLGVVALPLLKRFGIPIIVGVAVFLIIWFSVT